MFLFILCLVLLIAGYFIYGKVIENVFRPSDRETIAYSMNDGVDYKPMPTWKLFTIQLLNIAGTGPIFGAIMGAVWGPIVFIWIIAGCILGGAVHDYCSGMIPLRDKGISLYTMIPKYLGPRFKWPAFVLVLFVLLLATIVMTRSAIDMMDTTFANMAILWLVVIMIYVVLSAYLPIDQVIGKIYPVFGALVLGLTVFILVLTITSGYPMPDFDLANEHPNGLAWWPSMLITVTCGAISGFHSTQSTLTARCLENEHDGRKVFYGAMVVEGIIALIWASVGIAFFHGDTSVLNDAINASGAAGVVHTIAETLAGPVGGVLALTSITLFAITTSDTALRSARLSVQEAFHIGNGPRERALVLLPMVVLVVVCVLMSDTFAVLWRYLSVANQTMAAVALWTAAVYIALHARNKWYSLCAALPAAFVSAVVLTFVLNSSQCLGLDYTLSVVVGAGVAAIGLAFFLSKLVWIGFKDNDPYVME